jgi:hypothetical protein
MRPTYLLLLLSFLACGIGLEAQAALPNLPLLPALPESNSSPELRITQPASPDKPFSVIGMDLSLEDLQLHAHDGEHGQLCGPNRRQ